MTASHSLLDDSTFCWDILPSVSRTFAIGIKMLPPSQRQTVMVAYLLCRIADTIEDDGQLSSDRRVTLLNLFDATLSEQITVTTFLREAGCVQGERDHVRLLQHTDTVLAVWRELPESHRLIASTWIREMISGMKIFLRDFPSGIHLQTTAEFSRYCYYVAGTVGFLLTHLWVDCYNASASLRSRLLMFAESFGRGLQSVNILRDVVADVTVENAIYLPTERLKVFGSNHQSILDPHYAWSTGATIQAMAQDAHKDLGEALAFVQTMPRRWWRVRFFCAFPLFLAIASLRVVENTPFNPHRLKGPKISRRDVRRIFWLTMLSIFSNRALEALAEGLTRRPTVQGSNSLAHVFAYLYAGESLLPVEHAL